MLVAESWFSLGYLYVAYEEVSCVSALADFFSSVFFKTAVQWYRTRDFVCLEDWLSTSISSGFSPFPPVSPDNVLERNSRIPLVPDCLSCLARGMWFFKINYNIIALSHWNLRLWSLGVKAHQIWALYRMLAICKMRSCIHQGNSAQTGGTWDE